MSDSNVDPEHVVIELTKNKSTAESNFFSRIALKFGINNAEYVSLTDLRKQLDEHTI